MQDFDLQQDDRIRTVEVEGNKINLKRSDPYGFWTIHYEKGQVPQSLRGQYTSFDRAMDDVNVYLTTKSQEKEKENKKKNGA